MRVELKKVEPSAVHDGIVYEQTGVVESVSGSEFGVFDPDVLLNIENVGSWLELNLSVLLPKRTGVERKDCEKGIYPNNEDPFSFKDHDLCGEVVEKRRIKEGWYNACIDIGDGIIRVGGNKRQMPTVSIGDLISVHAVRVDVLDTEEQV